MLATTACGRFIYSVDIVNYGQNGIIILEMGKNEPFVRKLYDVTMANGDVVTINKLTPSGLEHLEFVTGREPTIPTKYRNPADSFGRFKGHSRLPKEMEVVWQLAELSDCERIIPLLSEQGVSYAKSKGYEPSDHANKSRCIWHPLEDKIYRKKIDMAALRESEAYKKTGKRNPNVGGSRYTLRLNLIFNEDQLTVEADNGSTNPWR